MAVRAQDFSGARRRVAVRRRLRALGPAMSRPRMADLLPAAVGAGAGLGALALAVSGAQALAGPGLELALVAPLAATAFLLFAVPSSPLAQPWSAVLGNAASALAALAVLALGLPPAAGIALAVAGAILAMGALRAMHPPGAAMALAIVLSAEGGPGPGLGFLLSPVLLDTVLLVALAVLWGRVTGRHYPFRLPAQPNAHRTRDPAPNRRLGLEPEDLAAILARLRLAPNLGVADFARLLGEAGDAAGRRRLAGQSCGQIMSRDLVTVAPEAPLAEVRALFRSHQVKTIPVVRADGGLAGIITQGDLIRAEGAPLAAQIMNPGPLALAPESPAGQLIEVLADGAQQAVPVVAAGRLAGLITRSDLIAALARR